MAMNKGQYRALESVVGPENISDDPVHLDAWAWRSGQAAMAQEFSPRFEAIVMPGSTEEVQAIVRLCNRFKIQFKASSTGWGVYCDPTGPGCLKLDLRRMNRILEINEENMYAVVEPYVITAQLQGELMKKGLHCNINGAGAVTSALPLAAHEGIGHLSQTCSIGERNQLALEWVTPEGEIVRTGSLGSVGEWFCGDGPGPSLRGIVRGNVMPLGGLGVYTKAATKIYHWPGPPTMVLKGSSPSYAPVEAPANFLLRFLSFPTEEGRASAIRKIGESEIGFVLMGFNGNMVAANVATSNEEELALAAEYLKDIQGPGFCLVIAGNSARDFEYRKQVLELIIEETQGRSLRAVEDGDVQNAFIWRCIRVTASIRETMRATGVFGGEVFGTDSYQVQSNFIQHSVRDKADLIERGLVYPDSTIPFITSLEHGQQAHSEVLLRWTPSPEVAEATMEYVGKANSNAVSGHYGLPHHVFNDAQHDFFGPHMWNYHTWLRRVKKSFDPNATSESSNHISAKD
ncbi:MAG: FAD-binding oxidoreductase [bacterium]